MIENVEGREDVEGQGTALQAADVIIDAALGDWTPTSVLRITAKDCQWFTDNLSYVRFNHEMTSDVVGAPVDPADSFLAYDAHLVALIEELEQVKAAAAAAQARATHALWVRQHARDQARGIKAAETARSVGAQVALARRESPSRGSRFLGFARAICEEMPSTLDHLTRGLISEWRASLLVRETAYLSVADRAAVDATVAPIAPGLSDVRLCAAARDVAYQLDPAGVAARYARAVKDRRVTVRPAPECMTQLSALLPVKDGVACEVALKTAADQARRAGDGRSRAQLMADLLVERVTGVSSADIPIKVVIVQHESGERSRVDGRPGATAGVRRPAQIKGHGPIPAELAAEMIADAEQQGSTARVVNIAELQAQQCASRGFPDSVRELVELSDGPVCRHPFCDARIQHIDHIRSRAAGGATSLANAQGLCEACNYLTEHPDWRITAGGAANGLTQYVTTRTPAGWEYITMRQ